MMRENIAAENITIIKLIWPNQVKRLQADVLLPGSSPHSALFHHHMRLDNSQLYIPC
jgi:hypothetical protein